MSERREKRKTWVQRGRYAVEVEIEVVYPVATHRNHAWNPPLCAASMKSHRRRIKEIFRTCTKLDASSKRLLNKVFV